MSDGEVRRSRRGFAAMDPEKQREIARKGGRASGGRPENLRGVDRRAAGRKGGQAVVNKYGPQHMAEIGRKGGRSSRGFGRTPGLDGVGTAGEDATQVAAAAEQGMMGEVPSGGHAAKAAAAHGHGSEDEGGAAAAQPAQ